MTLLPSGRVPAAASRVLEGLLADPGLRPTRLFALLLPVRSVEISGTISETQPYDVFDRYLSRAIAEAELRDVRALAEFFGMDQSMVERGVRFLERIGHLRRYADMVRLTELGQRSVRDGNRHVIREARQKVYFDGFAGAPLPRSYYPSTIWLAEPALVLPDGTRFQPLTGREPVRPEAIDELLRRPDREDFGIPQGLSDVRVGNARGEWLPVYVVECSTVLMVVLKPGAGVDSYLSQLVAPVLRDALLAEDPADAGQVWREWLDAQRHFDVRPRRLPNGVLRAALPASAFGVEPRWLDLGTFVVRERTFMQLWCDDPAARRRGVLERASAIVRGGGARTQVELAGRLAELAERLEVSAPTVLEVRQYAESGGDDAVTATLDELTNHHS